LQKTADHHAANTTVELPSGGSMMIGGLLQSENIKGLSGLPGAKNAPVIGDLIKSDSFQRNETELVVIVTAYLVEPYADKEQAVPIKREPNDMLSRTFKANIRRIYGSKLENVFARDNGEALYGYLIN
jgi:pilus assembly protein CpaC